MMTDNNQTATPAPAFHRPTPTVDIEVLWQRLSAYYVEDRAQLLRMVDQVERLMGISPRTSEIRTWWRKMGEPDIGDHSDASDDSGVKNT